MPRHWSGARWGWTCTHLVCLHNVVSIPNAELSANLARFRQWVTRRTTLCKHSAMTQMPYSADLEFDLLDRLQKSLRVSGKSRDQLAADLGVHRNTIGNYLNGKTPLDRRTLVAWSFSTGVPLEWLETGAGTSTT